MHLRWTGCRVVGTATTIPRHPTALFYNTATQAQAVDEYNWFYTLAGRWRQWLRSNCITHADSRIADRFTSYIVPTDAAFDLGFILSNDPRPFYAHTTTWSATAGTGLYHLLDAILGTYRTVFTPATPRQ